MLCNGSLCTVWVCFLCGASMEFYGIAYHTRTSYTKCTAPQVCSAFDLQPRGSAGEHSAAVGAKFDISNKQRMGFSEVQLVQKMINGVLQVRSTIRIHIHIRIHILYSYY
ncbi:hypothetical protein EON63_08245 [archaeon]|nr:MAG: hypothetical protein EON63_08245 [archaeon]